MSEPSLEPRRDAAHKYAQSVAGGDLGLYCRLFVAAYNLAYEAAPEDDAVSPGSAEFAMARVSQTAQRATATRSTKLQPPSVEPSIYDDPTYLKNAPYVISDSSRIIKGVPTDDFSDCVAVGSRDFFCCTGTLIAPNAVLTAAHCVPECSDRVFFGSRTDTGERVVKVDKVVVHPDYGQSDHDDLAVLLLAEVIDDVPARGIAEADAAEATGFARLVGFGTTDIGGMYGYGVKRRVDVPVASADPRFGARPETEFVAGAPYLDTDSCRGDSGGPAYVEVDGEWLLAGATSRATASSIRLCGDGGIYTRVRPYSAWIESTMR